MTVPSKDATDAADATDTTGAAKRLTGRRGGVRQPLTVRHPTRAAVAVAIVAAAAAGVGGCKGVTVIPNSDPALRRSRTEFAEDAELRHPFKSDAPSGGDAKGRAMVNYTTHEVEVANLSDEDWKDVEVWLNRKYVVFVPRIPRNAPRTETLNFQMFFDDNGHSFPTHSQTDEGRIHQLEILRDGRLYALKYELAD